MEPQACCHARWEYTNPEEVIHEPEDSYKPAARPQLLGQVRHEDLQRPPLGPK